jgi:predicted alpha/beta hydrolase family esterase
MKKALLLHGTSGSSDSNWLPWLKAELENAGWEVWAPDLPNADEPNIKSYNKYLLSRKWVFDDETIIIGHSSGAVAALGLLQVLPANTTIKQCVLVGSFKDDLGWTNLGGLFEEPFDFDGIKKHCSNFLLIHSDNDPYCPLEHAQYLAKELDGTLRLEPGQKHFSEETDPKYISFPLLKSILLD